MTMERLCELFNEFLEEEMNGRMPTARDINDFAGKVASCYEEYNYIMQILMDAVFPDKKPYFEFIVDYMIEEKAKEYAKAHSIKNYELREF